MDVALAARAHLLVTATWGDFLSRILIDNRVALVETAVATLVVAHSFQAAAWLREGFFPDAAEVTKRTLSSGAS